MSATASQAPADTATPTTADTEAPAPISDGNQSNQNASDTGLTGSGEAESQSAGPPEEIIPESPATADTATPLADRIAGANDADEYEALMNEMASNPAAFEDPAPAAQTTPQTPVANPEEAQAPPEGAAPAPEAPAPAAEAEAEQPVEGEGDTTEAEPPKGDPQFRFRPTNDVDAEAFRIYKAATKAQAPISMAQAIALAGQKLGQPAPAAPAPDSQQAQPADNQGDGAEGEDPTEGITAMDARANLKDLKKQQNAAAREGDLDLFADLGDQIGDAEELVELVQERENTSATAEREEHDTAFQTSLDRAEEIFPDFANAESEFFATCTEIDGALKDTEDPRYYAADKPLIIAQLAAAELGVVPMSKGRKKVPAAPAPAAPAAPAAAPQQQAQASTSPQPARTERLAPLPAASGASRTSGAPTGAAASLQEQIHGVKSTDEFDALAEKMAAVGLVG